MKLELRRVDKHFGAQRVLDGISLTVEGRAVALIGPSGGGKSTLLRILAGLEHPDAGEVWLDGERLEFSPAALLRHRRRVGVVFQAYNLFPHLSALENITLPLIRVHGLERHAAEAVAREHLGRFRLLDHAAKRPSQLSGGQRQRVAIARAVAVKPRLLLFDEPTSALDPEMAGEVLDLTAELRAEGRDLILVTHHLAFARNVADQVLFLADGQVRESGTAAAVLGAPAHEDCRRFLARVLSY